MKKMVWTIAFAAVAILGVSSNCRGATITYDGNANPETYYSNGRNTFSCETSPGSSWQAANGELTMTTGNGACWFGSTFYYNAASWTVANDSAGNAVTARMRLKDANSKEWGFYIADGDYYAQIWLFPEARYLDAGGALQQLAPGLDTTQYHTYSLVLKDGMVQYSVDNTSVTTPAYRLISQYRSFVIGDSSGASPGGVGSFVLDNLVIRTYAVPEPSVVIRWLSLAAVGAVVAWRWRRRKAA